MPDDARQTALITGANSGLGKAIARALAAEGLRVGMVVREASRGEQARADIQRESGNPDIELFVADLADQSAVRRLAADVDQTFDRLDLLVNNAGTAFPERRLSPDGIESALAINHLAPFLLTHLLLDMLKASAPAKVVNVGTRMNTAMVFDDLNWDRRPYRMMAAYGQSKLGMLHFTFELARRLEGTGVTVNCVFPGVFNSNLGGTDGAQGVFWKLMKVLLGWAIPTPEKAAERVLRVARSAPMEHVNGQYLDGRKRIQAPPQARDPDANQRLWEISERLIKEG